MIKKILPFALLLGLLKFPSEPSEKFKNSPSKQLSRRYYQDIMDSINTPEQTKVYLLDYLHYENDLVNYRGDYFASFRKINEKGSDDCDGGAIAAAALLKDNGHPPLFLRMKKEGRNFSHAIYIYQKDGLWGGLGIRESDCFKPQYKTVEELVKSKDYDQFEVMNLDSLFPDLDWTKEDIGRRGGKKIYETGLRDLED